MTGSHLGLVVEGPGDANSIHILCERIATFKGFELPALGKPIPCGGISEALKDGGLEGFIATAANRPGCNGIIVILDGEGEAVCELGPQLLARAGNITSLPTIVILADPLYEAWLVASSETMRLDGLTYNGAKSDPTGGIKRALGNRKYAKPTWQPRLTERLNVQLASRRSHSMRRFVTKLQSIADEFDSTD
jgi:hypothetical protein